LVEAAPSRPLVSLTRGQETELPSTVKVAYLDGSGDYAQRIAEASRSTVASNRVASAALPLVLDAEHASQISDTWLHETWSSRDRAQFALPPSTIALESGDVVTLTTNGRELPYRVIAIGDSGTRDIEARLFERRVYRATPQTPRLTSIVPPPPPVGPPLAILLDIPPLRDDESSQSGYVAAAQLPWPGSIAVWQSPEQSGFRLKCLLTTPATTGIVTSSVGTAHPWRLDHGSELIVALDRGALSSTTRTQLLAGSNAAAIEIAPNIYEILQFESADLIAPQSYRLTTLLRGQRGTEGARAAIPLGARFVLLDSAVRPVPLTTDELNLEFHWKIGAANRDIGDTTYFDQTHTFRGVGLAPLSPVHIRATRASNGDLSVTWIRRTRTGGDSWEATEVPLGEESESYAIDIRAGAVTKRTLTSLTPSAIYTVADQITDFGSVQPTVTVAIAQVSPTVGRGALTTATV
ncbi:MAG: phage tail protein, partial [Hyphomicrobiaceae bacterium]